jgi:hypothetical protein
MVANPASTFASTLLRTTYAHKDLDVSQLEFVEYLDDNYYDVHSDYDSAYYTDGGT